MNIKEYDLLQQTENNNYLAIDFDGVIHKNSKGFFDGTVYDSPIAGAIDAIKEIEIELTECTKSRKKFLREKDE